MPEAEIVSTEKDEPTVEKKKLPRFDVRDLEVIAQTVCEDLDSRRSTDERVALEKTWKIIDRQVREEPDPFYKFDEQGNPIARRAWMPEMELSNQAYTLEMLTADTRRLMQPVGRGPGFEASVVVTDEWLQKVEGPSGIKIAGDENEIPSNQSQATANQMVTQWLHMIHRQNDFWQTLDYINAETLKYGVGVPRIRPATKQVYRSTARGMKRLDVSLPVLVKRSIKNTYPDDKPEKWKNEGLMVGPSTIFVEQYKEVDLIKAAKAGSQDPDKINGGWMPKQLSGLDSDNGMFEVIEYEGDLIVPRSTTKSLFLPGMIVTVARGDGDPRVVRIRFNKYPFSTYSYILYNPESISTVYSSSPLMKGAPLQQGGSFFYNMLVSAGLLNVLPPVKYDPDDQRFAATGGPMIMPEALWDSLSAVEPQRIGDPNAMREALMIMFQLYEYVTGMSAPRMGAQTVSHTTAFAKQAELARGEIRTVDFARSALTGPITSLLSKEYEIGRDIMSSSRVDYVEMDGAYVEVKKEHLPEPEMVEFYAFGAGQPAEEQAREQRRIQSLQLTMQMEAVKQQARQSGIQPEIDITEMQRSVLREGGWTDVDQFFATDAGQLSVPPEAGAGAGLAAPGALTSSAPTEALLAAE